MSRFKPPYPLSSALGSSSSSELAGPPPAWRRSLADNSIRNWLRQADLDTGRRTDGLTTDEKQEPTRLRKENARLREERETLEIAAAWFAQESATRKRRSAS